MAVIDDSPRFAFRGVHIDVARNFHGVAEIMKLLDQMAAYKLNKLHLHLADDQGWRLQIPGLPELTEIGGKRCHDPAQTRCLMPQLGSGPAADGPENGYFTGADYIAILRAARARNIEVIPSFDMPGHSMAAITAMEVRAARLTASGRAQEASMYRLQEPGDTSSYLSVQGFRGNTINVCLESSFRFVEKVIDELVELHRQAGIPLRRYHIGGDETPGAWTGSPACRTLSETTGVPIPKLGMRFIERVASSIADRGIVPAVWSDGLANADPSRLPAKLQSNSWENLLKEGANRPHHQANAGFQLIVSSPDVTYFDGPYSPDPDERGNGWATRTLETRKVFDFMPDNLPANAEGWVDVEGRPGAIEDSEPLKPGIRFAGMQAQLWTERVATDADLEYLYFPRLIAFAERAWHRASWEVPYDPAVRRYDSTTGYMTPQRRAAREADWRVFSAVVGERSLRRLDAAGIRYRIPPAGARIVDGKLYANAGLAGLPIEYLEGAGAWRPYRSGTPVSGAIKIRSRSADGKRAGRVTDVQ